MCVLAVRGLAQGIRLARMLAYLWPRSHIRAGWIGVGVGVDGYVFFFFLRNVPTATEVLHTMRNTASEVEES